MKCFALIASLTLGFLTPTFAANETHRISILEREVSELREKVRRLNEKVINLGGRPISSPSHSSHSSSRSSTNYTIRSGDSLWKIARNNGTSVSKIQSLNPRLNSNRLQIGKSIRIPSSASATSHITQRSSGKASNYTIKSGDTLGAIASRTGMRLSELVRANPEINPDRIRIGQRILIPGAQQPSPPQASSRKPAAPQETSSPTPPRMSVASTISAPSRRPQLIVVSENRRLDEIATFYSTDISIINELNQVSLSPSQMIQKGSQIYVPKH